MAMAATSEVEKEVQPLSDSEIIVLARQQQQNSCRSSGIPLPPYLLSPASHETLISHLHSRANSPSPSLAVSEYAVALVTLMSLHPHSHFLSTLVSSLFVAYVELFNTRKIPRDDNSLKTIQLFTLNLPYFTPDALVSISESIVCSLSGIIETDDAQLLDVLPLCLDLILKSNEVEGAVDFVNSVFDQMVTCDWSKVLLVKLVFIIREFPVVDKNRRRDFLNKVFDGMKCVDLQDIPSLVYQLLVAAAKGFNKREVVEGIEIFFGSGMGSKANTSTARQVLGTALLHVNFAVKQDPSLAHDVMALLKSDVRALNHFTVAVLLSVSRVRKFGESCMGALKTALLTVYRDINYARACKWLPEDVKEDYSKHAILAEKAFLRAVNESNYGREHVIPSIVQFSFLLLESVNENNLTRVDESDDVLGIEKLSSDMLKILFEVHEMSRTEILEQCKFRILSLKPRQSKPIVRFLGLLVLSYPYQMLEHMPHLKELLDYFIYMQCDISIYLVSAMLPLSRFSRELQDYIILVLRKSMFNREETVRAAAAAAVIELILADGSHKEALHDTSSQAGCSQQGEISCGGSVALFLELSSLLERCLYQQAMVKEVLYHGLLKLVLVNPSTASPIFDFLLPHFRRFYSEEQDDAVQFKINSCFKLSGGKVSVEEPLECLLSCICWILLLQPHGKDYRPSDSMWACFSFSLSQENEGGSTLSGDSLSSYVQKIRKLLCNKNVEGIVGEVEEVGSSLLVEEKRQCCVRMWAGVIEVMINMAASELEKSSDTNRAMLESEIVDLISRYEALKKDIAASNKGKKTKRGTPKNTIIEKWLEPGSSQTIMAGDYRSFLGASSIYQLLLAALRFEESGCSRNATTSQNVIQCSLSKVSMSNSAKLLPFAFNALQKLIRLSPVIPKHDPTKTMILGEVLTLGPPLLKVVWLLSSGLKREADTCSKEGRTKKEREDREDHLVLALSCFRDLILICSQSSSDNSLLEALISTAVEHNPNNEHDFKIDDEHASNKIQFLQIVIRPMLLELPTTSSLSAVQVLCDIFMAVASKLPCTCKNSVGDWIVCVCKTSNVKDLKVAGGLVTLALFLRRPQADLVLAQQMAVEILNLTYSESSPVNMSEEYPIINSSTFVGVASSILKVVESVVNDLQWATTKLKRFYFVSRSNLVDQIREKALQTSLEETVYLQAIYMVNVLSPFTKMTVIEIVGPLGEQIVRLSGKLYKQLALMSKMWIAPKGFKQPLPSNEFQELVKITCKDLTAPLYDFLTEMQQNEMGNHKGKGKANKIKRENRCIPDLIFQIEDYERYLIQLSKATKVNLLRHAKRSTCRDFRIKDVPQQNVAGEGDPRHKTGGNPNEDSAETEERGENGAAEQMEEKAISSSGESNDVQHASHLELDGENGIDGMEVVDSGSDGEDGVVVSKAKRRKRYDIVMGSDDEA